MQATESEELDDPVDGAETVETPGTEVYGESDGVRGFSAGLGLHFFGIPVVFFLMWCALRFLEKDPEAGSSGVWVKTLGTIGATQVLYMLPAYLVAKHKRQPRAYRTGLLLSALGLFVLNVVLLYFLWK